MISSLKWLQQRNFLYRYPRLFMLSITTLLVIEAKLSPALANTESEKQLYVVTTLPDLAEVVKRVGGEAVSVQSLLSGREDAHFVDAVPDFIRKVADADIVCSMGLDLEVSWLPKVLSRSGNAKIQKGGAGFCDPSSTVQAIDRPKSATDRSMGDVHRFGNPHYNLSPQALSATAVYIEEILLRHRPSLKKTLQSNLKRFQEEMSHLETKTKEKLKEAARLSKNQPVVIDYHKEFAYFLELYGIRSLGSIEEKPGVPPSAARMAIVATQAKQQNVRLALGADYYPQRHFKRFTELSGIPFKLLPVAVQKEGNANSIEALQNFLADAIVEGLVIHEQKASK